MKRALSILLFLLLFVSPAFSKNGGKEENIEAVVNHWNELHNTKNINAFYRIYGSTVHFYGKQQKRLDCVTEKSKGLLKKKFVQQIITPLKIAYYNSGIIKVTFKKMVTTSKYVNVYMAYLLLEEKNGSYVVVGESDLESDQNLAYVLNIGDEVQQTDSTNKFILWSGALMLVVGGTLYLINRNKKVQKNFSFDRTVRPVRQHTEYSFQLTKNEFSYGTSQLTDEEKGNAFEKWIVERFDKKYFDLLEWRSDKIHADRYALSNMNPDFEFRFKGKTFVEFAVECKWRKCFYENKIEWAKDYQVRNYKMFEQKSKKKVFVVLGIGGKPSDPESVFIIPLNLIRSNQLTQYQLETFRKYNKQYFFFNPLKMTLT